MEIIFYISRLYRITTRANTVNKVVSKSVDCFVVTVAARTSKGIKTCGCTSSFSCNALNVRVTGCRYLVVDVAITTLGTSISCVTLFCTSRSSYNRLIVVIASCCTHCEIVCCCNRTTLQNIETNVLVCYISIYRSIASPVWVSSIYADISAGCIVK